MVITWDQPPLHLLLLAVQPQQQLQPRVRTTAHILPMLREQAMLSGTANSTSMQMQEQNTVLKLMVPIFIHPHGTFPVHSTSTRKSALPGRMLKHLLFPVSWNQGLAFDGTYFYGGANSTTIYKMDFTSKTLVGTISTSATVRHIAFDPTANSGDGGFWVGAWNTLVLVSRTGAVLTTTTAPLTAIAGSAYDDKSTGGPYLWLFNQTTGALGTIYQYKIATQALTGITHNANDIPGFSGSAGGLATSLSLVPGKLVLLGSVQQTPNLIFCYELKTMPNWFTLDAYSGDCSSDDQLCFTGTFQC